MCVIYLGGTAMDSVLGKAVSGGGARWPQQRKAAAYARRLICNTEKVEEKSYWEAEVGRSLRPTIHRVPFARQLP